MWGIREVHSPHGLKVPSESTSVAVGTNVSSVVEAGTFFFFLPQFSSPGLTWNSGVPLGLPHGSGTSLVWSHAGPLSSQAGKKSQAYCRVDHRDQWLSLEVLRMSHLPSCFDSGFPGGDCRVGARSHMCLEFTGTSGGLLKWQRDPWSSSRASNGNRLILRCDRITGFPL